MFQPLTMRDRLSIAILFPCLILLAWYLPQQLEHLLLNDHAGWAGLHMVGVVSNMLEIPYFTKARQIFSDGSYRSYNHHPSLFFLIHGFVLQFAETIEERLLYSYSLAFFFWTSGLLAIFALLRSYKISYLSAIIAITGLVFARHTGAHSFLVIFDAASILLSTSLFFAIFHYEKEPSRKRLILLYAVSILALLISWYVVFFIFVYGTWTIITVWHNDGFKAVVKNSIFIYCCVMAFLTVASMAILFLQVLLFLDTDFSIFSKAVLRGTVFFDDKPFAKRNGFLLLGKYLFYSFPLIGVLFLYLGALLLLRFSNYRKYYELLKIKDKVFIKTTIIFLLAVSLFHVLLSRWSNSHPFLFFWLMPIFAIVFAVALDNCKNAIFAFKNTRSRIIFCVFLIIPIIFSFPYFIRYPVRFLIEQNIYNAQNNEFIKKFERSLQGGISYDVPKSELVKKFQIVTQEKKSVIQWVGRKSTKYCYILTGGVIHLLSSHPNRTFKTVVPEGYQHIIVECKRDFIAIKNVTTGHYETVGK